MDALSGIRDLLWFENISPYNEPIFPFLGFGMLSIKQLAILGIGVMLAWGLWQKTGDYFAIIPAIIALILILKKENVIPIEIKIIKILIFHIHKQDSISVNKHTTKIMDKTLMKIDKLKPKLLIAKQYRIMPNTGVDSVKKVNVRNISYIYDKMFRMKIRLDDIVESESLYTRVQIVLDGVLYGTSRTDSNGEIMIYFIPEFPGKKLLQIYGHEGNLIYEETLNFIR